jgi:hypothetical protein
MINTFKTREEIINALVTEFNEKPGSFNNNEKTKSREKFWTYNRLLNYYFKKKNAAIPVLRFGRRTHATKLF